METKLKKTGFTLIELLVVIVIIGILSTISTATFKSYFGKARDAERIAAVQNIALMMKVEGADIWDDNKYFLGGAATSPGLLATLTSLFSANDYRVPKASKEVCYIISVSNADVSAVGAAGDNDQFVVSTWGETRSSNDAKAAGVIGDGTEFSLQGDSEAIPNPGLLSDLSDTNLTEALYRCGTLTAAQLAPSPAALFGAIKVMSSDGVATAAMSTATTFHIFIKSDGTLAETTS